jgi:hypothetical protein
LFIVALVVVNARGAFRSGGVDQGVLLRLSGADAEMGTAGTFVEMRLDCAGGNMRRAQQLTVVLSQDKVLKLTCMLTRWPSLIGH